MYEMISNNKVLDVYNTYPHPLREKLLHLRDVIFETALESDEVSMLEEVLKYNEPSYITKEGTAIRLAWKKNRPTQYGIYFNCQTKLIAELKKRFGKALTYEGNRGILFNENDEVDFDILKQCINLALTYHKIKHTL